MSHASSTNETHAPELRSFVESANLPQAEFPIQNLPFGVFRHGEDERVGAAIGDQVVDIHRLKELGLLDGQEAAATAARACAGPSLNPLMGLPAATVSVLRLALSRLLRDDCSRRDEVAKALLPQAEVTMLLPADVGDYTDFYCSIHHATNVGSMFRPDNPLMPNYKHLPVGYHGRSSSLVPSGTEVRRPQGQSKAPDAAAPSFGPSRLLDYELEVGFFVGQGNALGSPIPLDQAEEHIFGYCLVNDWSARDIQAWEYQPLGPFLAKSFATTVSPWVVTTEALAPYRVAAFERASDDPQPLPHLSASDNAQKGGLDLQLEAYLLTPQMRQQGLEPHRLSRGNFRHMYWTAAQMLTHHASAGCNLRPGDLMASGTVSGPEKDARGCLLEITWRGRDAIELPSGESRTFLQDGDEVVFRGYCEAPGAARIGFGECRGVILPAVS